MISSITLDDHNGTPVTIHLDTSASKTFASQALGLVGGVVAAPRQVKSTLPNAHGAINNTKYTDGASITLACEVQGTSIEDAYAQFRTISAVCQQTLDYGPALLKWTEGETGLQLQRLVRLDGAIDPPVSDGVAKLQFQLQFFAEDPRAYNQTETTVASSTVASLLANTNFSGDTIGAAPAHWTAVAFDTFQVETRNWQQTSIHAVEMVSSTTNNRTASSDKFTVAVGKYAAAVSLQDVTIPAGGSLVVKVATYAGATDIEDFSIGSIQGPCSNLSGVIAGLVDITDGSTTSASLELMLTASASASATAYMCNATVSMLPIVSVTNNGLRDTPQQIELTGSFGDVLIQVDDAVSVSMNDFQRWVAASTGGVVVDYGERTFDGTLSDGYIGLNPTELAGYDASVLMAALSASATQWGNLPDGSSDVSVIGLLAGSSFTVKLRDAY